MNNYLDGLNEEQKEAVVTTEGYIRVIAGAGTGKTKTLTTRYVHLVENLNVSPKNILCVTFTNKAANEMRKRIRKMTGKNNDTGFVCTFHSFCTTFLKEEILVLEYPRNFIILDEEDIDSMLSKIYTESKIKKNEYPYKKAKNYIEIFKRKSDYVPMLLKTSSELKKEYDEEEDIMKKILKGYLFEQRKVYGLDFDDLIVFTLHILDNFEDICLKWQKQLKYIMVDEFQDVSNRQYRLATKLSEYNKNLFVVGDPDQTIYSFRGANVRIILDFDKKFKGAKTIKLKNNYRSIQKILNASNQLISHNKDRIDNKLTSVRLDGEIPVFYHGKNYKDECEWIAEQIKTIGEMEEDYGKIAVLYRGSYLSRGVEEALMSKKIPYIIYSGISFYSRKEIKDLLSYLRMISSEDDMSFRRIINVPRRGFGPKRMEALEEYSLKNNCTLYQSLKDNINLKDFNKKEIKDFVKLIEKYKKEKDSTSIADLLEKINEEIGYEEELKRNEDEERIENIEELKSSIFEFEQSNDEEYKDLDTYLSKIALYTNMDKEEKEKAVKLMTVHSAKGLEFNYVFVCGMSEGQFPSRKSRTEPELEEERRLAYVACTRAKDSLYLTDSEGYDFEGIFKQTSRFVNEIGKDNLYYVVKVNEDLLKKEQSVEKPDDMIFSVGDKVIHEKYGIGNIIMVNYNIKKYVIKFETKASNVILDSNEKLEKYEETKEINNESKNEKITTKENNDNNKEINEPIKENEAKLEEIIKKLIAKVKKQEEEIKKKEEVYLLNKDKLNEEIKNSSNNIAELNRTIKQQKDEIDLKNEELLSLKEELLRANEEINSLKNADKYPVTSSKKESIIKKLIDIFKN